MFLRLEDLAGLGQSFGAEEQAAALEAQAALVFQDEGRSATYNALMEQAAKIREAANTQLKTAGVTFTTYDSKGTVVASSPPPAPAPVPTPAPAPVPTPAPAPAWSPPVAPSTSTAVLDLIGKAIAAGATVGGTAVATGMRPRPTTGPLAPRQPTMVIVPQPQQGMSTGTVVAVVAGGLACVALVAGLVVLLRD